ncbi:hypothetical protein [Methanoregula sp. UBA64]|jgi:hypothetical protein|uniref:hypothetical protein n=1 Tax=Methanoregula sp. UBA64 TaxID=1915554 RepID=UPI0025FF3C05|nr:hypothetical protein [Methanoregula sp. UBA64]
MAKIVPLPTRAFGAEPDVPDVAALAGWIAEHRGTAADLHAYQLDVSLAPQLAAGITTPCAGGLFCRDRVLGQLTGLNKKQDTATGEIDTEGTALSEDAALLAVRKKNIWCALPAPSALGVTDAYYGDEEEWQDALARAYQRMMRNMRDAGTGGHVLIGEKVPESEVAALAGKNVFFFVVNASAGDLEIVIEHQREVAVPPSLLGEIISLTGEYDIRRIVIVDPDEGAIKTALSSFDPDQISTGGYCTSSCDTYWKKLAESAVYRKE